MVDFEGFSTDLSCLSTICLLIHLCLSTAQIINLNRRLLPNTVLDVYCWAEDNCKPEIREEGDISLCPSDCDSLSLLFCAKCTMVQLFFIHPPSIFHMHISSKALKMLKGGIWLVSSVCDVWCGRVRDLNISRNLCTFPTEEGCTCK